MRRQLACFNRPGCRPPTRTCGLRTCLARWSRGRYRLVTAADEAVLDLTFGPECGAQRKLGRRIERIVSESQAEHVDLEPFDAAAAIPSKTQKPKIGGRRRWGARTMLSPSIVLADAVGGRSALNFGPPRAATRPVKVLEFRARPCRVPVRRRGKRQPP